MMDQVVSFLTPWLNRETALPLVRALLLSGVGLLLAGILARILARVLPNYLGVHRAQLFRRIVVYGLIVLFGLSALRELGFQLGVLLGAAGILTVALGFASQTSASNLVSGLFMIAEQPFAIGDTIRIGGTTGEVLSVDLLSVKLRTFDNLYVRIPNESMIKSEITNLTRFPIRRLDLQLSVAYKENLRRVVEILLQVAGRNPLGLEEPKPLFIILGFGDSGINIQFSIWAARPNFLELRNSIQTEIKEAFDAAGIEIPFPHRALYTGSITDPFPVRLFENTKQETQR